MELSTVRLLADLNRRFYEQHAENFADSRPRLQPGVRRILDRIAPGARVLELGCGDGKVARALTAVHYTGLDQSAALLERAARYMSKDHAPRASGDRYAPQPIDDSPLQTSVAQRGGPSREAVVFLEADLLSSTIPDALPPTPFDWILAFAVFHHLPSHAARQVVLDHLARRLAPGGQFVMSNWQFHTSTRLLRRQVPWSTLDLTPADVEPGDALLTWERKGRHGLRYVHALATAEAHTLAAAAGLQVTEVFQADGVTDALAEYVVAKPAPGPA